MIRIQNIYYMLSYAFQILKKKGYAKVATEEFENVGELCSEILIKGVSSQIKRGLGKEYISKEEALSSLRGKIDLTASIKEQTTIKRQLVCRYDEFSVNSYMNRIIRTTMELLLHSDISRNRKSQLRKLLVYFVDVEPLVVRNINWHVQYNRNNQNYQMLVAVCFLIVKGLLQTTKEGNTRLMDFGEEHMYTLYEKFILEYFRQEHPELKATASKIPWDLDDENSAMLPEMQSDIMLENNGKTLVIDAKYYSHATQVQFNVHKIHSANLYQIYTYVKNLDKYKTGSVSGMLLYAKTDEDILPNNQYHMSGNSISVKTLDLDCDFLTIRKQLDEIARQFVDLGEVTA